MRAFVLAHAAAFGFEADGDDVAAGGIAGFVGGDEDVGVAAFGAERAFRADEAEAAGGAAEGAGEVFGVAGRVEFWIVPVVASFLACRTSVSRWWRCLFPFVSNAARKDSFGGSLAWFGGSFSFARIAPGIRVARAPGDSPALTIRLMVFFNSCAASRRAPAFCDHRRFDRLVVGVVDVVENGLA